MPVPNRVSTSASTSSGSSRRVMLSTISIPATVRALDAYQRCCWTQSRRSSSSTQRRISSAVIPCRRSLIARLLLFGLDQLEPEEAARPERQEIGQLADAREARAAEQLDW